MSEPRQHLPPFEQVIEEYGRAVLRFCAAQAGWQAAEDVFQETMLAALRAYDELRDATAIRSWLFAIAARKAVDAHRKRAREPEPVADLDPPAAGGDLPVRNDAIWRQVRTLPDKQRSAVALRYVADLSHREIARVMGISEAAARRNVFEGLEQLRRQAPHTDLTNA
jgi:RNA polymerase sigma factor (sigma-70 family)